MSKNTGRPYRLIIYVGKKADPSQMLYQRDFEDVQQAYSWLHKLLQTRQLLAPHYYLEFWYQKRKLIVHWVIDVEIAKKKRQRKIK